MKSAFNAFITSAVAMALLLTGIAIGARGPALPAETAAVVTPATVTTRPAPKAWSCLTAHLTTTSCANPWAAWTVSGVYKIPDGAKAPRLIEMCAARTNAVAITKMGGKLVCLLDAYEHDDYAPRGK